VIARHVATLDDINARGHDLRIMGVIDAKNARIRVDPSIAMPRQRSRWFSDNDVVGSQLRFYGKCNGNRNASSYSSLRLISVYVATIEDGFFIRFLSYLVFFALLLAFANVAVPLAKNEGG
jgi:hypothetical protein